MKLNIMLPKTGKLMKIFGPIAVSGLVHSSVDRLTAFPQNCWQLWPKEIIDQILIAPSTLKEATVMLQEEYDAIVLMTPP